MEKGALKDLFKRTLVDFLDSLINILPTEADLIVARIYVNDKVDSNDLINYFILTFMDENKPFKKAVEAKNEKAFLEAERDKDTGKHIFGNISDEKVQHFKYLWRSGTINGSNKNVIWKWLSSFVKITEKYQECKD